MILFVAHGVRYAEAPGWPGYAVGEDGAVWSQWTKSGRLGDQWRRLRPGINGGGYSQVALYAGGKRKYMIVSRLVLLAFVGPPPKGMEAKHANHKRYDNRLGNLSWGTKSENAKEREAFKRRGRRGEDRG